MFPPQNDHQKIASPLPPKKFPVTKKILNPRKVFTRPVSNLPEYTTYYLDADIHAYPFATSQQNSKSQPILIERTVN